MKVVCYNLDQRMAYPSYAKLIIELLRKIPADVIVLQEIMKWQHVEQLAHALNMHCDKGAWFWGGQAVISKYPILECHKQVIPKSWRNAVVGARIKVGGKDVWCMSVHLTDIGFYRDETERLRETEFILNHLPKIKYAIIAGDFNSISHLDSSKKTNPLPSRLFESAGWVDAQAGKPWVRSTWMAARGKTILRIDRIYLHNLKPITGGIVDHIDLGLPRWPTGRDHRLLWQTIQ